MRRTSPDINWDYAVVQRMDPQDLSTRLIPFNLGRAVLDHDAANDIALQPGDIVTIFSQSDLRVPELKQTKFVRLTGSLRPLESTGSRDGQRLRDLVQKAGGLTPSAYLYGAQFSRESVRIEQRKRLDQMIAESELNLNRRSARLATTSTTTAELEATKAGLEAERASLEILRRIQPDGRIVLNLHPDDTTVDAIPDLALEDGDQFYVPSVPATVTVIGDVYNQGSYLRVPGKTVNSYLRNCGWSNARR